MAKSPKVTFPATEYFILFGQYERKAVASTDFFGRVVYCEARYLNEGLLALVWYKVVCFDSELSLSWRTTCVDIACDVKEEVVTGAT